MAKRDIWKVNHRVKLVTVDWDKRCQIEIAAGKGFRITEEGITDKNDTPGLHSIHSPLYGTDWADEDAFKDRYSCACKKLIGKNFEGTVCPDCGKPVQFIDIDIEKNGWIIIDDFKIIQSEYYKKLNSFIGKRVFPSIIKYVDEPDRDPDKVKNCPFYGIGIMEFERRFKEIMEYYLVKNKKVNMFILIMSNIDKVFASCIPVYSTYLRPLSCRGEEIRYTDEDLLFRSIFTNTELLNDQYKLDKKLDTYKKRKKNIFFLRKENILFSIQMSLNKLWDLSFEAIKKKTGRIRENLLGGRLDYTARNVIIPNPHLNADEVELGYITFLELYKLQIISFMVEMYQISYVEAWDIWEKASVCFSEDVYSLMQYMVKKQRLVIIINRNPTINYGSQLAMKIVKITRDINNHTMGLPIPILPVLNADFDGDILNIMVQVISHISDAYFTNLNPRSNLFISKNDGKFNADANLFKDEIIGLYAFANI